MLTRDFYLIGLMSGTSLDGVDLVYVRFNQGDQYTFDILSATTIAYSTEWISKLTTAYSSGKNLDDLDIEYGNYLGELVNSFRVKEGIEHIDFIASHGHTIFHKPDQGYTLQIGNGQRLANTAKLTVICDFRTQDVALGGEGAPLVPLGDKLLFSQYDYCLNLGGFANVSYQIKDERIAFDICPVNIVLNRYAQRFGLPYDNKGLLSRKGQLNKELFETLNGLSFYLQKAPKSLGLEWVESEVSPILNSFKVNDSDVLRTFTEHIAHQITRQISQQKSSVLITGGGAFNEFLIERIREGTSSEIVIPKAELIEYKEALVFAFLGLLKYYDRTNVLSSVTGASKDHSSGKIFNPDI